MKFKTNLHPDIPRPVIQALSESGDGYHDSLSDYLSGEGIPEYDVQISVTSLIKAPRQVQLIKRHYDEIEKDPMDMLWSMKGQIIHTILEEYAKRDPGYMAEVRKGRLIKFMGKRVYLHGQFDLLELSTGTLFDFKYTSEKSLGFDKSDHDWQLNILKWISRERIAINSMANIYILKHLENRYLQKNGFPVQGIIRRNVEMKPESDVREYIAGRLKAHLSNIDRADDLIDGCTDEERWYRPEYKVYKATKKGEISKVACFKSQDKQACEDYGQSLGVDYEVRTTKNHPTRCVGWCDAAPFCNKWKQWKEENYEQSNSR